MHLTPNMYKIMTLKAHAKIIVTWKCVWHQICTKSLLWRQMLRKSLLKNAFDQINHLGKMSPVLSVSIHIYGDSEEIHGKTYILRVNLWMYTLKFISLEKWHKTCTLNIQLLHNTKRPTKWSGHAKIIDPPKTSTYERPFTQEGNYLVYKFLSFNNDVTFWSMDICYSHDSIN